MHKTPTRHRPARAGSRVRSFWSRNRNVMLLMFAQACFLSCSMTVVTFAGLTGELLATNKALATLPMSLSIVSTAVSTGPMSMLMQWRSRRFGFRLGAFVGIIAAAIAAYGVYTGSFLALCVGTACFGPFQASAQYYRFAAAESVSASGAPRAISLVLIGGLLGALVAPGFTRSFNDLFMPYNMMGAFVFAGCVSAFVLLPVALLRPLEKPLASDGAEEVKPQSAVARPLAEIARNPAFIVAVLNGALGYAMMSFVMTATPLAMKACGLMGQSIDVIQGHVIAMFLPSLFTGSLIQRFGLLPVLLMGHACCVPVCRDHPATIWMATCQSVRIRYVGHRSDRDHAVGPGCRPQSCRQLKPSRGSVLC